VPVYLVYVLNVCNATSVSAAQIVLSLYALHLGASALAVGVVASTFSAVPMLLAVTAGRLVDRYGGRWPMTVGAACGGAGLLVPHFVAALPAIYVASTMCGLAIIFFNLSTQNLVGLLSTPETRARNFSNYTLTTSVSFFLGPLLGGFSIDHAGYANACLAIALLTLAPLTLLALRGKDMPGGTRRAARSSGSLAAMVADPAVRRTLATGSLVNAGINLYQVYTPVYARSIGLSASAIGVVLAMYSAAAFMVRFVLPRLIARFGIDRLLAYAFFVGAAGLVILPLLKSAALLAIVSLAFGLGMGCGQPFVIMQMFSNSRDGRSGEALGLKFTVNQCTKLVSPIAFGAIASAFGLFPTFWLNAAMMATGGLLSRVKDERV
jgi:MFS family permease